jgi:hypothetical protein
MQYVFLEHMPAPVDTDLLEIKQTFIAATLGLLCAGNVAYAATTVGKMVDLGTLNTANIGSTYTIGTDALALGDSFQDIYVFDIAGAYSFAVGTTVSIDIANLYELTNLEARLLDFSGAVIDDSFSLVSTVANGYTVNSLFIDTALATGNDYRFVVSGTVSGTVGGSYGGVLQATPIPEANTYVLMLAGLGLLGLATRRRKIQPA